jgi:hypothetical protein
MLCQITKRNQTVENEKKQYQADSQIGAVTEAGTRPVAAFINHNPAFLDGTLSSVPSPQAGPDWCEAPVPALIPSTGTSPDYIDSDDSDPTGHDPAALEPAASYPSETDKVAPAPADPVPYATEPVVTAPADPGPSVDPADIGPVDTPAGPDTADINPGDDLADTNSVDPTLAVIALTDADPADIDFADTNPDDPEPAGPPG